VSARYFPTVPSNPRRILFIVSAYQRTPGDVITPWLNATIAELGRIGIEVEVLAPAYHGSPSHVVDGVRIHRFRYAPAAWEMLSHDAPIPSQLSARPVRTALVPGYVLAASAAAVRLTRGGRFDVVHAFWPLPHAVPALFAKRLTGVPFVSTFFGAELHWLAGRHSLLRRLVRAIVDASDVVTAISTYTARELQCIAPDAHPIIVPFGAAVAPARADDTRDAYAYSQLMRDDRKEVRGARFTFVGRLVARKGVDVLLRAFALLHAAASDRSHAPSLTIIGDGDEREALQSLANSLGVADRVTFAGYLSNEALDSALRDCFALVLPAVPHRVLGTEGLGVALIEALSYGRAVIASNTGGIPDVVIHERTGLLVAPGDAPALAAAMQRLIDDPTLARQLGDAGRAHVEARFSWPAIVGSLRDVYARAMETRRR
jgi:glycosyltransferase involved in cell wall biosynthesis